MSVDNSTQFVRISDLNPFYSFTGPTGAAFTASLYADAPGQVAELHFFDEDNNELDNTGFESCAVDETHRGILALMNNTGLVAPGNIARIRIVHGGGSGAIYIGQCGQTRDQLNTLTNTMSLTFLNTVSQPVFDTIYEGGYRDVGFTSAIDSAFSDAIGTVDDPPAGDGIGGWSLIALFKRLLALLSPSIAPPRKMFVVAAGSNLTVFNPPLTSFYCGVGGDVTAVDAATGVPVLLKAVPQGVTIVGQFTQIMATGTTATNIVGFGP